MEKEIFTIYVPLKEFKEFALIAGATEEELVGVDKLRLRRDMSQEKLEDLGPDVPDEILIVLDETIEEG